MIEIRELTKRYGDMMAINNLNFSVRKGEVVGFLGPNGAGKSTTMKIITGYMAPSTGSVKVAGYDVFEHPLEVKRRIGYLPETPPVYLDMYVREYLTYVAKLKGVEKAKLNKNVDMSIDKTNLGAVQKRIIGNLSKGFRQRVGIAQALVSDPELLILDEPTVGLDPKQVSEIRNLIQELKGQHTIMLSTHILPEVQAICERIIIINQGTIVAEDTLQGLNNRMTGSRRIMVRCRKSDSSLLAALRAVPGVRHLESRNSVFEIDTDDNEAVAEQIAKTVVKEDAGLLEMRSANLSLEDIFLKLTSSEVRS